MRDLLSSKDGEASKGPKCPISMFLGNNQQGLRLKDSATETEADSKESISIAVLAKWWKLSGFNRKTGQAWESTAYRYTADQIRIFENQRSTDRKGKLVFEGTATAGKTAIQGQVLGAQICGIAFYKEVDEADFQISKNSLCLFQFSGDLRTQVMNANSTCINIFRGPVVDNFLTWEVSTGADFDETEQASAVAFYVEFSELEQWHKAMFPATK